MKIIYTNQEPPEYWESAIFLAGPTPRGPQSLWEKFLAAFNLFRPVPSWRPEALRALREQGYNGVVFVPETEDGEWKHTYDSQIEWEEKCLNFADVILFWVPRELVRMPAFTTNIEWGFWTGRDPMKLVPGFPKGTQKMRYLEHYAEQLHIPVEDDLIRACAEAIKKAKPALRMNGERSIPIHLWRTASFQSWHQLLLEAGNTLVGARVESVVTSTLKPGRAPMVYMVRPWVHCAKEDRIKSNEAVVFRSGMCSVALVRQKPNLLDSEVVTIREFRPAVANAKGFVHELPGGSSHNQNAEMVEVAQEELREEVGLDIQSERFVHMEYRQPAPTLSAHLATLFRVDATDAELEFVKNIKLPQGVQGDSECTYPEVHTVRELLADQSVDWTTLGMVMSALKNT